MVTIVRTCMVMTVENQRVAHDGLVQAVGRYLKVFYADDSMIGSRDPDCLQHLMNVVVGLFWRYGLVSDVTKSHLMACQPGALRSGISVKAKSLKCTGVGDSYRVRIRCWIPFPEYGVDLVVGSITAHHCRIHRTEPAIDCNRLTFSQTEHHPQV